MPVRADLKYYRYPQYTMARTVAALLAARPAPGGRLVDAPCGDGIIAYWLNRWLGPLDLELVDIDPRHAGTARRYLPPTIPVAQGDVRDLFTVAAADTWLLINSLYLLPDPDDLVQRARRRMRYIAGVFPDISHDNYRAFMRRHPGFVNCSAMDRQATLAFFARHGYGACRQAEMVHIPFHRWRAPLLDSALARLYPALDRWFAGRPCGYWGCLFERADPAETSDR